MTDQNPTETIKTIPTSFSSDGWCLKLVERVGRRAIFSKARPRSPVHSYEVAVLEKRSAETINGKWYESRESYPRSEDWGISGWTYKTLAEARRKMAEIAD